MPAADDPERADVELRVPADSAYISVLRTTTAGLAARLDFTLDDVEDLRMAVGEAAAMVLEVATGDLTARFWSRERTMTVAVAAPAPDRATVDRTSFGWQVLTTLAGEARASTDSGRLEITLVVVAAPLGTTS